MGKSTYKRDGNEQKKTKPKSRKNQLKRARQGEATVVHQPEVHQPTVQPEKGAKKQKKVQKKVQKVTHWDVFMRRSAQNQKTVAENEKIAAEEQAAENPKEEGTPAKKRKFNDKDTFLSISRRGQEEHKPAEKKSVGKPKKQQVTAEGEKSRKRREKEKERKCAEIEQRKQNFKFSKPVSKVRPKQQLPVSKWSLKKWRLQLKKLVAFKEKTTTKMRKWLRSSRVSPQRNEIAKDYIGLNERTEEQLRFATSMITNNGQKTHAIAEEQAKQSLLAVGGKTANLITPNAPNHVSFHAPKSVTI